jgi:flagellar FliJ protein
MTKSQRLKPVSHIAESRERDAARLMGEQQQHLDQQYQKLDELRGYRAEYAQRMQDAGANGIDARQMLEYNNFLRRLDEAARFQQQKIEESKRLLEIRTREWRALHTRTEALNKVVSRFQAEEQRVNDRREQHENDDRAQHRCTDLGDS